MIKIQLSDEEMNGLTDEEKEIALARKLEIKILPLLRRNINFFYAGANIPKKSDTYWADIKIEEDMAKMEEKVNAVCRPLCETVSEILNANGVHAETVSCDTDIFRHVDVLITTSSGKQYIINYLEDMEMVQTSMRTPDFASKQYYDRRYKKFEGKTTTDGKKLDYISFVNEEQLGKIDNNLGYKQYGMYIDDVVEQIRKEFNNFRNQMTINEIMEGDNLTDEDKAKIKKKWAKMSDDEILERKLDWIFNYFNFRGDISGHTDFVMYYSKLLLGKLLSEEEYKKINRFDCFVRKDCIPKDSELNAILDFKNNEEEKKMRFCIVSTPLKSYVFSTKPDSYLKMTNENLKTIENYAKITKSQKPSDLVLLLADAGSGLPLVFNPLGQKFLDERADLLGEENRDEKLKLLAQSIRCTDGRIQDGGMTSITIPYDDGSERLIYIDENNEFAEIYNGIKKIYHYDEDKEEFTIEISNSQPTAGENEGKGEER